MSRYPYLIITKDNIIQGYVYAGSFVGGASKERLKNWFEKKITAE